MGPLSLNMRLILGVLQCDVKHSEDEISVKSSKSVNAHSKNYIIQLWTVFYTGKNLLQHLLHIYK